MHYPLTYNLLTTDSTKNMSWSKSAVAVSGWSSNAVRPSAPNGVFGRLGLRNGDAVKIVGRADQQFIEQLPGVIERAECANGELPNVYLVWAGDAGELRSELAGIAAEMNDSAVVWAISALPGKTGPAGEAICQLDLLDAGHSAGLVDNRVTTVNGSEYGYRFAKPRIRLA